MSHELKIKGVIGGEIGGGKGLPLRSQRQPRKEWRPYNQGNGRAPRCREGEVNSGQQKNLAPSDGQRDNLLRQVEPSHSAIDASLSGDLFLSYRHTDTTA